MTDNLSIYNAVRAPPKEALRQFKRQGGFAGTEISPMWRIKALTETFGPCGIGWYSEIAERWTEAFDAAHVKAFVTVRLYIRDPQTGEWSKPIVGTGGNDFIAKRAKRDQYGDRMKDAYDIIVNDECYKMAETDALGSACKKLGFGADVYWSEDRTKYTDEALGGTILDEKKEKKITIAASQAAGFLKRAAFPADYTVAKSEPEPSAAIKTDRPAETKLATVSKMARRAAVNEALRPIAARYGITPQQLLRLDHVELPPAALDEMYIATCQVMREAQR